MSIAPITTTDSLVPALLVMAVLMAASLTDIASHKIYNWLTYPAIGCGFALAATASLDSVWPGLIPRLSSLTATESFVGIFGCGGLMLVPYCLSHGGAGDVKLAMAIGSLLGFQPTIQLLCIGYLIAALYLIIRWVIACAIANGSLASARCRNDNAVSLQGAIPLAGFFACGGFILATIGPLW